MSEFSAEKENTKERLAVRRCPKCDGKLIKFGGYVWNSIKKQNFSFTIGRICKICDILYIDPRFKDCEIVYSVIGARHAN